jgi:hypothetical protein
MKRPVRNIMLLLAIGMLSACSVSQVAPIPVTPTVSITESRHVFSEAEMKTLASLKQVDDHPLYMMQYYGEYTSHPKSSRFAVREAGPPPGWACSLFTALLDDNHLLYGRNFDWDFSRCWCSPVRRMGTPPFRWCTSPIWDTAMKLLAEVVQGNTQWSVVYQMARGEASVVMDMDYENVHVFRMSDYLESK